MPEDKDKQTQEANSQQEENFASIDPETLPDELKSLYKSMQADYTRKTQDLSSRRKEYDEREKQWQEQLKTYGAVEQEVEQWRNWYKSLEEQADDQQPTPKQEQLADVNYLDEPDSDGLKKYLTEMQDKYSTTVSSLREEIASLKASLSDTTNRTSRMFNYHAQLNELGQKYKDLNKQELLEYALKTGQPDLDKAYKDLHQDDFIEQEVERRLADKEKELRTRGIRGPGQQVILKRSESSPKSFTEASEQVLRERAAQGL